MSCVNSTRWYSQSSCFFFCFFFILRRMGKNKALAHHTSTYFHTRRGFLACPSVPVGDTARAVPTGSHSLLVLFSRNPHNEVRGHRTGSSLSGVEEYPREKTHTQNQTCYPHVSLLTQFMPLPEEYKKVKSRVSRRCSRSMLVHTSHYSRLNRSDHSASGPYRRVTRYYSLALNVTNIPMPQVY